MLPRSVSFINKITTVGSDPGCVFIFSRALSLSAFVAFIKELSPAIALLQTLSCFLHNQGHRVSLVWKSWTEAEPISSNCSDSSLRPALTVAAGQKLPGKKKKRRVVHSPSSVLDCPLLFKAPLKTTWSNGYSMFYYWYRSQYNIHSVSFSFKCKSLLKMIPSANMSQLVARRILMGLHLP